ncbi:hypothetical protein ACA910_005974 [Epithemia clementina (nom. ined.)]
MGAKMITPVANAMEDEATDDDATESTSGAAMGRAGHVHEDVSLGQDCSFVSAGLINDVEKDLQTSGMTNQLGGCSNNLFYSAITSSTSAPLTTKKRVSWGSVDIHTHSMTIGDNPSVSTGLPVTLTWDAETHESLTINRYKQDKSDYYFKREINEIILSRTLRDDIARSCGLSRAAMKKRLNEVMKAKQERQRSARDGAVFRTIRKLLCRRSSRGLSNHNNALRRTREGWSGAGHSENMPLLV